MIGGRDSTTDTLNESIELLTSTKDNNVKGIVTNSSILKVTKKLDQPEETWLPLEICSSQKTLTTDPKFLFYLQP